MRIEMLPGMSNVVRFPVERRARPTLELLRGIAPDVREVLSIAEAFDMEVPADDLRARVDESTASYIRNNIAGGPRAAAAALDELLAPPIARAVYACRVAHDMSVLAAEAQQALLVAQTAGGYWLDGLRERAESLTRKTAERLIEAHVCVEEAEGVARAVGIARRGEVWCARDPRAEAMALFG